MINKNKQTPSRIPIRFIDEEGQGSASRAAGSEDDAAGGLTPEEIGRASIYEGETEVQQRIDRGQEQPGEAGRTQADERDRAGSPEQSEIEESRNDLDTTPPSTDSTDTNKSSAGDPEAEADSTRNASARGTASGGPLMAELVGARAELRRLQTELHKARDERQDLYDKLTRRQADFENYRKRVERERTETYQRAVGEVVVQLLPVVDNLRRALAAEASMEAGESEEFRHFLRGVELINKQLNGVLDSLGLEAVETVGQPFDPHVHEAIAAEESDAFEPDTVMEEIVRGYRLGDKLLRPAMVKVAK